MELTLRRKAPDVATGPFTPGQPRVNLVPQSSKDRAQATRDKRLAVLAWTGSVLALGAWWGTGYLTHAAAETQLAAATSTGETLALDLALYAPVTTIAAQTQSLTATVAAQTATEVDHAKVIDRFLAAVSGTLNVQTMVVATDNTSACVSTDPFSVVPLAGCITFTGTAGAGSAGVASVITALSGDPWFADSYIPTISDNTGGPATVSGTVGLTVEAYTSAIPTTTTEGH
jgi:hypothetical protein